MVKLLRYGKNLIFLFLFLCSFNPSMYERHTFWSILIGGFTYWTSFNSVNQTMVQRYMSLPNLKKARQYEQITLFTKLNFQLNFSFFFFHLDQ